MLLRTLPRACAASAWRGALGAERTNAPLLVRPITTIRPEKKYPVVVLGGGTAAGYAAAELAARRAFGPNEVCIVSREAQPPYERPALSKGYLTPKNPVRLPKFHTCVAKGDGAHDGMWYVKQGIRFMGGQTVEEANLAENRLVLESGLHLVYDQLIVATGAWPVALPGDASGYASGQSPVHYVREEADASRLYDDLVAVPRDAPTVVVGGGYIAVEVLAAMVAHGLKPTVVFPEKHLWANVLPAEMAAVYTQTFEDLGVRFMPGTAVEQLTAGGLKLDSGAVLESALTVAGLGVKPNTALFAGQLELDDRGAILVDPQLRTSRENVFAVGDAVAFPNVWNDGAVMSLGHVNHARQSGIYAARQVAGEAGDPYRLLPICYSRFLGFQWRMYGVPRGETVLFGNFAADGCFGALWRGADGRLSGAVVEGASDESADVLKAQVDARVAVGETSQIDTTSLETVLAALGFK